MAYKQLPTAGKGSLRPIVLVNGQWRRVKIGAYITIAVDHEQHDSKYHIQFDAYDAPVAHSVPSFACGLRPSGRQMLVIQEAKQ